MTRGQFKKVSDYILNKVKLPITAPIRYKRYIDYEARKLNSAIQQLSMPIDILEIQESFGTAQSFIKISKIPVVNHGPCIRVTTGILLILIND